MILLAELARSAGPMEQSLADLKFKLFCLPIP